MTAAIGRAMANGRIERMAVVLVRLIQNEETPHKGSRTRKEGAHPPVKDDPPPVDSSPPPEDGAPPPPGGAGGLCLLTTVFPRPLDVCSIIL